MINFFKNNKEMISFIFDEIEIILILSMISIIGLNYYIIY